MKKETNAYLIKENQIDGSKEYFDFEEMKFRQEKPKKTVAVSTIDALTTLFETPNELEEFFNEYENHDNSFSRYYIESNGIGKSKKETKRYQAVWDDVTLSALSKIADGNVDFTGNLQYNTLLEIMSEIAKEDSDFDFFLDKTNSEDTRLNKESKSLVIAHSSDSSVDLVGDFIKNFGNYIQCRALYLGYKQYKESKNKAVIKIISWKQ